MLVYYVYMLYSIMSKVVRIISVYYDILVYYYDSYYY